jgi:hypothetical protein
VIGRVVHFVHSGPTGVGCRPAVVIRVQDPRNEIYRLRVLLDEEVDSDRMGRCKETVSSMHDREKKVSSFHYLEECLY